MTENEVERYGSIAAWSKELVIGEDVLQMRLKDVKGITGRTHDGSVLVDGFFAEADVRRLCADLLK